MSFKPPFTADMTLKEAQDELRSLLDGGFKCPCCTQLAKVYRRKVHSSMARALIVAFRKHGQEFFHLPSEKNASKLGGDFAKLGHWGMVEEEKSRRPDGGRAGWWRVTEVGENWIHHRVAIPKYVKLYDGRPLGYDGDRVSIHDALGDKFNYDELMAGV